MARKVKTPKVPVPKVSKKEKQVIVTPIINFVESIIEDREDQMFKAFGKAEELQTLVSALKNRINKEAILNERRQIINKRMSKLSHKSIKEEDKKSLYDELIKDIKTYDNHFAIDYGSLLDSDLKV